jgi:hypothetical protein
MRKISLSILCIIFLLKTAYCQIVAYKPVGAYVRGKETLWEWTDLELEYDQMPVIKVYYNNSTDAYSRIDRVIISNTYKDDFRFPYRGVNYGTGVLYSVIDNQGKKIKILLDFAEYDEGYFDMIFKYSNIEYAYRLIKQ